MLDADESPALGRSNEAPVIGADGRVVPMEPRAGFRVLPYLQKPASDQMTINWFTELGNPATIIVRGPGLPSEGRAMSIRGEQNSVNSYQEAELAIGDIAQPGLPKGTTGLTVPQGAWVRADRPWKYQAKIIGLEANSDYTYEVMVDGYRHLGSFTTMPEIGELPDSLRIIAYSDSETDPVGRVTFREWQQTTELAPGSEARPEPGSQWEQKFGSKVQGGEWGVRYALTEDMAQGYNNAIIAERDPDMLLLAGDLVERGSSQTHWDEFWDYFAGSEGNVLSSTPMITSLGNHEVYGYCSGTISEGENAGLQDCPLVVRARMAYNQAVDTFGSDDPATRDAYHRVDQGKVTYISLDVTNGEPDMLRNSVPESAKSVGDDSTLTPEQYGTDTQATFTKQEYDLAFNTYAAAEGWVEEGATPDQPNFLPGSAQYQWLEDQLKDARDKGQLVIVQYHHAAYSNGVHGTPMGNNHPDSQSGVPVRHLQPLFERYDVGIVISGHDEMFEASWVDEDSDGRGTFHWDVGVASDGLRADKRIKQEDGTYAPYNFNTHSIWSAQSDEPELWRTNANGVRHLVSGGKHYGHLEMEVAEFEPTVVPAGQAPEIEGGIVPAYVVTMTPVAAFPVLDDNYDVERVERRELTSGVQHAYYTADGAVVDPDKVVLEVEEEAPVEYATSSNAASVTVEDRDAYVWGTTQDQATIRTQVLVGGRWMTSQTREVEGGYVIPLTYGRGHAGTYTWRLQVTHADGTVELTDSFTQRRLAVPSRNTAGVAPVGRTAHVWGTVDGQAGARVWTEVRLPNGGWVKSQEGRTTATGGYVVPLTYGQHTTGTYRWRVAAEYEGLGVLRSEEFTFVRR